MKYLLLVATSFFAGAALAAPVSVSISVGQPGFYGHIDIGGYPHPQVIYAQPIAVQRVPMDRPPIYLRVPPGHAKHWSKHCHEYHACGERVYFIRDDWYNNEYVPRYRELHRDRDERRENSGDERREDRHGDNGRGRGKGHDR